MKELIILVADKNAKFTLMGLISRHRALSIRKLEAEDIDIYPHPRHDPGVYNEAGAFLQPYQNQYRYALVFLDREGSGQENKSTDQIANEIKTDLKRNGWQNRSEVIVFDPELEVWAWVRSPHLANRTGWPDTDSLRSFLADQRFWELEQSKPERPKEAFEALLREKRIKRSSSIYKNIAREANFQNCVDPSFRKFERTLHNWFGSEEN